MIRHDSLLGSTKGDITATTDHINDERLKPHQTPDDVRTEYAALVEYFNNVIRDRYTIAGLYAAAVGLIANVVLAGTSTWEARTAGSLLACWITACLYVLDLRSRSVYTNIAHRGIDIEHRIWGLVESSWYAGFFSRQFKVPPVGADNQKVPQKPGPDRPKISWMETPISERVSRYISHSFGLDLLYSGSFVFWSIALVVSIYYVVFDC